MPAYRDDDAAQAQLELQAVPPGTAVSEVVRQLTTLLTDGNLVPGSRLPPERKLAEQLGVGRSAVREALAALEVLGIVAVRPGSGTYLRDSTSELLPTTLSWGLMLSAGHTDQLSEVRSALEVEAASLAACRAAEEDLATLDELVAGMRESVDDPESYVEADARFHLVVSRMAGNEVLTDLLRTIRSLLRVWMERRVRTREEALLAAEEHERVLVALRAGDSGAARAAMRAHMRTARTRVERA